jgi:hypothetical protein
MTSHWYNSAFADFAGVPLRMVYDYLKAALQNR